MKYFGFLVALIVCFSSLSQPASAQSLNNVSEVAQAATSDGQASQARIDKLDDETDELTRTYRAALKQLASLREYNAQMEKLIKRQKAEMVSIRQQIEDVTNVDRTIVPLMIRLRNTAKSSKPMRLKTNMAAPSKPMRGRWRLPARSAPSPSCGLVAWR